MVTNMDKIKEWYGEDFPKKIGAEGGKKKNPKKGFGSNPELARKLAIKNNMKRRAKDSVQEG